MPRVRREESFTKPWLRPTSVSIRVTGTAISKTLNRVRIGRWLRFAATRLAITLSGYRKTAVMRVDAFC
jgi:hypothetical protein